MGQTWNCQGLKVKANIKTDKETPDGDQTTFQMVMERDIDGIKTTVSIKVQTPDGKLSAQNPLNKFLMGQAYDLSAATDQTTLPMPKPEEKKKNK